MWREENSVLRHTEVYDYRTKPVAFIFEGDYVYIPRFKPIYLKIREPLNNQYINKAAEQITNVVKATMQLRETAYTEYSITFTALPKLKFTITLESEFISEQGFIYMKDVLISQMSAHLIKENNLLSEVNLLYCVSIGEMASKRLLTYQRKFQAAVNAAKETFGLHVSSVQENMLTEQCRVYLDVSKLKDNLYSEVVRIADTVVNIFTSDKTIKNVTLIFRDVDSYKIGTLYIYRTRDNELNIYTKMKLFHLIALNLVSICQVVSITFEDYRLLLREAEEVDLELTKEFMWE